MGYIKWKAMNKVKFTANNFAEIKTEFLLEVKHVIAMDVISTKLVINFDHIGLNIVPTLHCTMETDRVELAGKDDKKYVNRVREEDKTNVLCT